MSWTGIVLTGSEGSYSFAIPSIGSASRLWVNGVLVLNNAAPTGDTVWSTSISFMANQRVRLSMEYTYNGETGGPSAQLLWQGPGFGGRVIVDTSLYPMDV